MIAPPPPPTQQKLWGRKIKKRNIDYYFPPLYTKKTLWGRKIKKKTTTKNHYNSHVLFYKAPSKNSHSADSSPFFISPPDAIRVCLQEKESKTGKIVAKFEDNLYFVESSVGTPFDLFALGCTGVRGGGVGFVFGEQKI